MQKTSQVCKLQPEAFRKSSISSRLYLLIVFIVVSTVALLQPASADLFQNAFPYADVDGTLRVYLAKRGLNYQSISQADLSGDSASSSSAAAAAANDNGSDNDADGDRTSAADYDFNNPTASRPTATPPKGYPEVYLLEDKDYPRSVFENYAGVGQVSGLTALPSGDLAIFHRADREWTEKTFNNTSNEIIESVLKAQDNLIKNDTIMIIDGDTGNSKLSLGANLFYMPHGVASDSRGNLWLTDVGRHQVMRLPTSMIHNQLSSSSSSRLRSRSMTASSRSDDENATTSQQHHHQMATKHLLSRLWPDIILGEAFVPGQDEAHFCKPSEVVVSSNDKLVFVADGYCNKRVMVFTGEGKFLASFGEDEDMDVVHSLTLIEERNLICVADRENGRILCFKAGLDGDLSSLGEVVLRLNYPIGRVFALTTIDANNLLVSGNQVGTNKFDLAALNPFRSTIKQIWTSSDLLTPHSLTKTKDGRFIYAADMSKEAYKKVFKFYIIQDQRSAY